ncbi:hypothetical protein HMPREF1317_1956 [Schaalia georgiae F0490]|uniref:Uncharacterized protein n=1 Tax=Schaalia georgiae F0490 TaxID=1125717 RepID=J0NTD8_9ACTO|nr:hypothetical protein HMPREF1317_1956 [Schaalia georgiae F0490]
MILSVRVHERLHRASVSRGGALISKSHGLPVVAWFFKIALYFGLE